MRTLTRTLIAAPAAILLAAFAAQQAPAQLSEPSAPIQTYAGDPGRPGDPASWRTAEFNRDVGMVSIGAEYAYAAGYGGAGMSIGVVDSGVFAGHVREHGSLATNYAVGDRYFSVPAKGGHTGLTPGFYDLAFNDTHGTHVTGTIGASRDGIGETTPGGPEANMHGVAFNSDVYVGNTHKTDGVFYGMLPDNATEAQTPDDAYLQNVYRAVNKATTRDGTPIRIVTSSWGSAPPTENYNTYDAPPGGPATFGLNTAWRYWSLPDGQVDANGKTVRWMHGAIDVARTGTIIQFTAGNAGVANPTPRGAAPYFLPDLEGRWFTTSGINTTGRTFNADGSVLVPGQQTFNQCGVAKWSCVTAPSNAINSTTVVLVDGVPQPRYQAFSGTSMAGPHAAAAMALIMQRFPYLNNEQALYTMFTTGRQNNTISDASGVAVPNPERGQIVRVPDRRNGWGTVSLREAFQGPGQLLDRFDVDTHGYNDIWSNDISDVAIQARKLEDQREAAEWAQTKADKGWLHGLPSDATAADKSDYAIGTRREAARAERQGRDYVGSLTKRGAGTLFLTGDDTWHGQTSVRGGEISVVGSHASTVRVVGGGLSGNGTVVGNVNVDDGVLRPGLTAEDAAQVPDGSAGNVLTLGGKLRIGPHARLAVTVRGDSDYTSVAAAGSLVLNGALDLDVQGSLTPGTVLTLLKGRSVSGSFDSLPEGSVLNAGGYRFKASYKNNSVTVTVVGAG